MINELKLTLELIPSFFSYQRGETITDKTTTHILKASDIVTGKDVLGNQVVITGTEGAQKKIERFDKFLRSPEDWYKEWVNEIEVWFCSKDRSYQVERGPKYRGFSEEWSNLYPSSSGSGVFDYLLKVGSEVVKRVPFVYCDAGSISVPIPDLKLENDVKTFLWTEGSLEYNLGLLVGKFSIYEGFEGLAKGSQVEITKPPKRTLNIFNIFKLQ